MRDFPTGQAAAGDLNGSGTASVIVPGAGQLCFSITVQRIGKPNAAHIHQADAGRNGPIVVPLVPIPGTGNPGTSSGCVSGIAAALLTDIRNNPGKFYVNVHTTAFPLGPCAGSCSSNRVPKTPAQPQGRTRSFSAPTASCWPVPKD